MDQHAAERVLYEQLLEQMEREETASQKLLLPETVELAAPDAAFLGEQVEIISRLGVGLGAFGERTFLLDALPPFVKAKDSRVRVIVDRPNSIRRCSVTPWRRHGHQNRLPPRDQGQRCTGRSGIGRPSRESASLHHALHLPTAARPSSR